MAFVILLGINSCIVTNTTVVVSFIVQHFKSWLHLCAYQSEDIKADKKEIVVWMGYTQECTGY